MPTTVDYLMAPIELSAHARRNCGAEMAKHALKKVKRPSKPRGRPTSPPKLKAARRPGPR